MVEDKYIGLALAVSGTLAIGSSIVLTKKGLRDSGDDSGPSASDNYAYFRSPMWWAGMSTMVVGEIANFAAYTFAPPILVTPLGALSVLIGAVLASFLLNEQLGHLGRVGCALALIGSTIIVIHAPEDKPVETVDEILEYALHPGFLMYCLSVLVFTLLMVYVVAPKHGRSNPLIYISICSLVGSVSVMAIKAFGIAVKLTLSGNNQFTLASTYIFGFVVVGCILVQMNYFNKALDTFSTNVVNPMYYVGFSTATLVASLLLFQGLNTSDATNTLSLLLGFVVTFLGVHLLNISRDPEPPIRSHHTALESGLMNPRLSISGRMSIDGWEGVTPRSATHNRRSSRQNQPIFDALDEYDGRRGESVGLDRLREASDEEDDDDEEDDRLTTERTRLHHHSPRGGGSPRI